MDDDVLNEARVDLIDNDLCNSFYQPAGYPITDEMICAGTLPDFDVSDTCQGDSGKRNNTNGLPDVGDSKHITSECVTLIASYTKIIL